VGLKTDLRENLETLRNLASKNQKPIHYEQGNNMSERVKAKAYLECSAMTETGVGEVFEKAIRLVMERRQKKHNKLGCCPI
jgi:GTPase SAR1 family protein